ncbi:MAG: ABC transporter ATP-binding protein [Deltaproteobacteria bacterium]|nr:ABC transporter ATP-binding protein [Deltaproteobacteria bacterium]
MTALLQVDELKTYFFTRDGLFKSVDGISLTVKKGKTLALVGESGSGKSVSMLSLLGLIPQPPGRIVGGKAFFHDRDLLHLPDRELQALRGEKIAMIFQDPMTSLNPYLRVSIQLTEGLRAHHNEISKKEARRRAIEALEHVGIPDAKQRIDRYPHEFSGGMRQRVMIAMALISRPELLIADEPTTALDVTIQAQILNLLKNLQKEMNLSIILITHDLGVVAGMADEICVMYAGKIVERGTADDIFYTPSHPYTIGLLGSMPRLDSGKGDLKAIPGLPPDPSRLPKGCPFADRCPKVMRQCRDDHPLPLRKYSSTQEALCYWEKKEGEKT